MKVVAFVTDQERFLLLGDTTTHLRRLPQAIPNDGEKHEDTCTRAVQDGCGMYVDPKLWQFVVQVGDTSIYRASAALGPASVQKATYPIFFNMTDNVFREPLDEGTGWHCAVARYYK